MTEIALDAAFSEFNLKGQRSVVAAVSGGGDSVALLLLIDEHLRRRSPKTRLIAATVDHGLRPSSATESEWVARLCQERGIVHRSLRWTAQKPGTNLLQAAREARHRLLAGVAAAENASLVLTGHTADDQAETVWMRRKRGAGRGLAGVAPATLFEGRTWFLRPLLGLRREALRTFLRRERVGWIDDSTNEDPRFERARARRELQSEPDSTIAALLGLSRSVAAARLATGEEVAALVERFACRVSPGLLRLLPEFLAQGGEAPLQTLRILLATAGGREHLPDAARVGRLLGRLAGVPLRDTLSRCLVEGRRDGIFLHRETRGLPLAAPAVAGTLWDGRFRVTEEPSGTWIAPFCGGAGPGVDQLDRGHSSRLMRDALAGEPRLEPGLPAAPQTLFLQPVVMAWARYLPCFDLVPANAVAALVGAPANPAPPWTGHNARRA